MNSKHTPGPRAITEHRARMTREHAELVAALRALLDMPMIVCVPPIPGPNAFGIIDQARALLARVDGVRHE